MPNKTSLIRNGLMTGAAVLISFNSFASEQSAAPLTGNGKSAITSIVSQNIDTKENNIKYEIKKEVEKEIKKQQEIARKKKLEEEKKRRMLAEKSRTSFTSRGSSRMAWPAAAGTLTSGFGARWGRQHKGIDIGAPIGTGIKAALGGKVIFSGWANGYGNFIKVQHSNGIITQYAHCSKSFVSTGQQVKEGQVIAAVGNTGRSTGPHLHFEVLVNGKAVDPKKFI